MTSRGIDILNSVNSLLGWPQIQTIDKTDSNTRRLLDLLDRTCRYLGDQTNWNFLRGDAEIITVEGQEDGSVSVVNGSTDVTFTGTTVDASKIGYAIAFSAHPVVYRITEVLTSTSVRLNRIFLGDTNTESGYLIVQDQYSLATDFSRPLGDWAQFFGSLDILPATPDEFAALRRAAGGMQRGEPSVFTVYGVNPAGTAPLVHLHPYPDAQRLLTYEYHKIHPKIEMDSDRLLFPVTKEELIIAAIVEAAQRNFNDDSRADAFLSEFIRKHNDVLVQNGDRTATKPRITMADSGAIVELGKWSRRKYSVDWGSAFDLVGFYKIPR